MAGAAHGICASRHRQGLHIDTAGNAADIDTFIASGPCSAVDIDGPAGIAVGNGALAGTHQAADTDVIVIIKAAHHLNIDNGGAAGQAHVADARQAAQTRAAPAGAALMSVHDGIAGHGAVLDGAVRVSRTGHAHQAADAVPVAQVSFAAAGDSGPGLGIEDDVRQRTVEHRAEQAGAGGVSALDIHILDEVAVAVVGAAEPAGQGTRSIVAALIVKFCDGGINPAAAVDIVGLEPVESTYF